MSDVIIPSSPEDRQQVRSAIQEISNSMTRIEAEQDHIKAVLTMIEERFEIPKKQSRKLASAYHKQNADEVVSEMNAFETLYEAIAK
jgi:phage terminase large subunit-like protein